MAVQRRFKRMLIDVRDEFLLLQLGEMEIWDGADLALLREGLFRLIDGESCQAIVIDMHFVSGTWFALTPPQPNVQRMLWFRQFFKLNPEGLYEMLLEPTESFIPTESKPEACLSSQTA